MILTMLMKKQQPNDPTYQCPVSQKTTEKRFMLCNVNKKKYLKLES